MNKKIAEVEQGENRYSLWSIQGEGYVIYENGIGTHHITAPNEEIAEGYFNNYITKSKEK